jgi:hypothetical protein
LVLRYIVKLKYSKTTKEVCNASGRSNDHGC